jgi:phosphatidylglycerophosphate synthase
MQPTDANRRPLKSRNTRWAAALARTLARVGLRPNAISVLSAFFAAAAGASLILVPRSSAPAQVMLLITAALGIQLRLLCNLLDGMVAIEGGFRTKAGEIYNELPDRFADALVLMGAGYASRWLSFSEELGWAAAVLAVITAYCRALGVTAGASQQFVGPMAKPHRMAVLTGACLLSIGEVLMGWPIRIIPVGLAVIVLGCAWTIARRVRRIVVELNSQ